MAVSYRKADGRISFTVEIPAGTEAVFRYGGGEYPLHSGENQMAFDL